MSQGDRMSLAQARGVALEAAALLRTGAVRVEVAGSIRRGKLDVGDIEIVAIPRFRLQPVDLFGERTVKVSEIDDVLAGPEWELVKGGDRYKQVLYLGKYTLDLFIQPDPATWGVNLALRTGSRDFSKWLVTPRAKGGALPAGMWVRDARLWRDGRGGGERVDTPEEADFFREIRLAWLEPAERVAGFWWQVEKYASAYVD